MDMKELYWNVYDWISIQMIDGFHLDVEEI